VLNHAGSPVGEAPLSSPVNDRFNGFHAVDPLRAARLPRSRNREDIMRLGFGVSIRVLGVCLACASVCAAQTAPAAPQPAAQSAPAPPAPPAPLSTPAITGPLQQQPPANLDAGILGNLSVNGVLDGMGMVQGYHVPGDDTGQAALMNGQIFIQKTDGWWQFYVQAGAYDLPALGAPFLATDKTVSDLYGPVPVAYLKLAPGKNTSILIGSLPTLIGAEYTFSFENMNIVRGLLWNQENAITRGIQLNQTMGKFSASVSWTDGFYSNRYNWLTGLLAYTNGPHSIAFVAGGNLGQTVFETSATPVQNNSSIYNVIYTYSKGAWILQPYFQYTNVPTNAAVGVAEGASSRGVAVLLSRTFKHGLSLAGRWEYISTTGDENAVNLLFGPGSAGTSFTVTPTFQHGGLFVRGEFNFVHASSYAPGDVFGQNGLNDNQPRAVAEVGFIFGHNLLEKP
jgi:Putative beta-barrel porin-2, OmpL-like. bbp2